MRDNVISRITDKGCSTVRASPYSTTRGVKISVLKESCLHYDTRTVVHVDLGIIHNRVLQIC